MSSADGLVYPEGPIKSQSAAKLLQAIRTKNEPSNQSDLSRALYLSVHLISLSMFHETKEFLQSFMNKQPLSLGLDDTWDMKDVLSVLAFTAQAIDDQELWDSIFGQLTSAGYDESDLDWIVESAGEELRWEAEEEPELYNVVAHELSDGEKREGLITSFIVCAEHFALLTGYFRDKESKMRKDYQSLMNEKLHALVQLD